MTRRASLGLAPRLILALVAAPILAQAPAGPPAAQVAAMKRLSFLAGSWKGTGTIDRGPGVRKSFSQSETVAYKLGGLVLVIDGLGTAPDGTVVHQAFATVTFDPASGTYRFTAYDGLGRVHEGPATVGDGTFEWGMETGPVSVRYAIRLDGAGRWAETGEMKRGNSPGQSFFEMTLAKQP